MVSVNFATSMPETCSITLDRGNNRTLDLQDEPFGMGNHISAAQGYHPKPRTFWRVSN